MNYFDVTGRSSSGGGGSNKGWPVKTRYIRAICINPIQSNLYCNKKAQLSLTNPRDAV